MSLLTDTELKKLDYAFVGEPMVDILAKSTFPATGTLDYAHGGQPFVGTGPLGVGVGGSGPQQPVVFTCT